MESQNKKYARMKKVYNSIISYKILALSAIVSVIVFSGCNDLRKATGPEDEIWVIADSIEYENLSADLFSVFGKVIYTPQPERLFTIKRASINSLENLKRKKNILIVAPLNSGSYTSQYLNEVLDSKVKKLVESDSLYVINKYDLWAKNQIVMFLTSKNSAELRKNLLLNQDQLLKYFRKKSNERLYQSIYNPKYERKKVEAEILKDNGWLIYVQADFQLSMNNPDENFVWLRRSPNSDMERWIFVHWIDNASPSMLNADSVAAIRDRVTKKFYRTMDDSAFVKISDQYLTTSEVNFNGRYALLTQGLWQFDDHSGGGPFISYTFYDEKSGRLYMLDGSIFAPKYHKKSLIQQVDVMLQSFRTKDELSKDKIEDLMDELED